MYDGQRLRTLAKGAQVGAYLRSGSPAIARAAL